MKKILSLLTLIIIGIINTNTYSLSDIDEKDPDLVNELFYSLSGGELVETNNIYWCKNNTLFIEPFPIEYYKPDVKDIFDYNTKVGKTFIKYYGILNRKIRLNNQFLLQRFITNICDKNISELDEQKILGLYNNLTNYIELSNMVINNYIDIYKNMRNKFYLKEEIKIFKNNFTKLLLLKERLNNLETLKINIKNVTINDYHNKNYIKVNIVPENKKILVNWNKRKISYINLIINKKHFKNNFLNIKTLYILGKIKDRPFTIKKINTILYK